MNDDFKEKMIELARKLGIELEDRQLRQFFDYMTLLLEWNEKINLTTITDIDEVILKHFIDSMTVLKYINNGEKIIDVGTGAGFPGIPIAIMMPDVEFTLLDSLNKRISFLNEVIEKLNLKNIKTVHGRAEDFGQNKLYREKYDKSISRAVANLTTLSEYLIPFIKVGGEALCMKGADIDEEEKKAMYAVEELGGKIISTEKFSLPDSDISRSIIIINKEKETPKRYPRKAGTPSKDPLKDK